MKRRSLLKSLLGAIVINVVSTSEAGAVTWGYRGKTGAEFWGEIDLEYRLCSSGKAQSPIDLPTNMDLASDISNLKFNYRDTPLAIINNGRTIRVDYQPGSSITLDGRVYELLQFHFHQPSEHLILGEAAKMEAHFVHKNQDKGELVVLAVLMREGEANQALDAILQNIPQFSDRSFPGSNLTINALQLLPENTNRYYRYRGSLTTPPCSETVTWLILKQPIEVSKLQIARFLATIGTNARPVQALNQRSVSELN